MCFLSTLRTDRLSHNSKPQHHMLCLSVLCLSRDHFNHLCSINGKIPTTYISPHETKKTLPFRYELLGSFRSVNRSQGCSCKILRSQSRCLKARSRSGVWKRWPRSSLLNTSAQSTPAEFFILFGRRAKNLWKPDRSHFVISTAAGVVFMRTPSLCATALVIWQLFPTNTQHIDLNLVFDRTCSPVKGQRLGNFPFFRCPGAISFSCCKFPIIAK